MSYAVSVEKASSVRQAIKARFTSSTEDNLILVKSSRIEVYNANPHDLKLITEFNLYAKISILRSFRSDRHETDLLLVLTEQNEYSILSYNSRTSSLVTEVHADLSEKAGRTISHGPYAVVDPENKVIVLQLYLGTIKIIPIGDYGKARRSSSVKGFSVGVPFNLRMEELNVRDMTFLHDTELPTLAVLYDDRNGDKHLKTYQVDVREKELEKGSLDTAEFDQDANFLVPIPGPVGGVLVVGEVEITYLNGEHNVSLEIAPTIMKTYGYVESSGARLLLGDDYGRLYVLLLQVEDGSVVSLKHQEVGRTSTASSIVYLDDGCFYVASHDGDQQLIEVSPEPTSSGDHIHIVDTFTNLAPILDFLVVDVENQGQSQIVACTGAYHTGALRIVRHGVGLNEQAQLPMEGIRGVWSIRKSYDAEYEDTMLISFLGQTRIFSISVEEELEELECSPGFEMNESSLAVVNMLGSFIAQITEKQVRLIDQRSGSLASSWKPEDGSNIILASANPRQIVLSCQNGRLTYLELKATELEVVGTITMPNEIACLAIDPCGEEEDFSPICAVGQWTEIGVKIVSLPSMQILHTELLDTEIIPRSVALTLFESTQYLLLGLGDGTLYNFIVDPKTGNLSSKKGLSLGTQPIHLTRINDKDSRGHVFAASDRPTVIFGNGDKIGYSNVNLKEVSHVCSFHSSSFPNSLVVVSDDILRIGSIDDYQRIHIKTIPLGETPRRVEYHAPSRCYGVCTVNLDTDRGTGIEKCTSFFRTIDASTHDLVDAFEFDDNEIVQAVTLLNTGNTGTYFAVGTAATLPQEDKPFKGRVILFSVDEDGHLLKAMEKEVKGGVFSLATIGSNLLAGVNSKVLMYAWEDATLRLISDHYSQTVVYKMITHGEFVVIGDLIHSVSVLRYDTTTSSLKEVARDMNSNWISAVEMLSDGAYIAAESEGNLLLLRRNEDAMREEDQKRLLTVGMFHVGERINQIRKGSLMMASAIDSESEFVQPSMLYVTVNGSIGVLGTVSTDRYELLNRMQIAMAKVLQPSSVGGLSHSKWRSFTTERERVESKMFVDGDLIERFHDMDRDTQEAVVDEMNASGQSGQSVTSGYLSSVIENVMQIH